MNNRVNAVIRLIVTIVSFVNVILIGKGCSPIPFDEATLTEVLSYVAAGFMTFWTWYKDAPMTKIANKHHDEMVLEKRIEKGMLGENFFDTVEEVE